MSFYILKEDGGRIELETGPGALLLEATIPGPAVDWQAGGRGRPVKERRNETEALFQSIEQALRVALGLADEPVPVEFETEGAAVAATVWSEARLTDALEQFRALRSSRVAATQRYQRLESLLRAYEDERARQEALRIDDEETWMLMS